MREDRVRQIGTIDEVLARFERTTPPPGDEKRHFHGVYHRNTIAVKQDLERGRFLDPDWVEPWDVVFANLYLDALEAWERGENPSGPWAVAFRAARDPNISPLVHTLVGLNAHLNFDLPQALLAVVTDDELTDRDLFRRRYRDFKHIDDIVVRRVKEEDLLLREVEEPGDRTLIDRLLTPLNRSATKRFLKEARYKVWRNAIELSLARRIGSESFAARLAELEALCRAKVEELVRPGRVLLRLAVTGYGVLLGPPTASGLGNPADWPEEVLPAFDRFLSCSWSTVSQEGPPVTYQVTPFVGARGSTLDVSCGLTSPANAEHARRNPAVGLLYSDPTGSGVDDAPVVLVLGRAAVRDADLQRNTDRYAQWSLAKIPAQWRGVPGRLMRELHWYWTRIWVEVTPERILWWPGGRTDEHPRVWDAPLSTDYPASDPPPSGPPARPLRTATPGGWRDLASTAPSSFGPPVLTAIDGRGRPMPIPTKAASFDGSGFLLDLPAGHPLKKVEGPACLTFARHTRGFNEYENLIFAGQVQPEGSVTTFTIERALPTVGPVGSRLRRIRGLVSPSPLLRDRVRTEAARRGQELPRVRIPRYR